MEKPLNSLPPSSSPYSDPPPLCFHHASLLVLHQGRFPPASGFCTCCSFCVEHLPCAPSRYLCGLLPYFLHLLKRSLNEFPLSVFEIVTHHPNSLSLRIFSIALNTLYHIVYLPIYLLLLDLFCLLPECLSSIRTDFCLFFFNFIFSI